jgi:DNA-binding MarR family transcriptional regulator
VNDLPEMQSAYGTEHDPALQARRAAEERVVDAYQALMHHVASAHAPEFVGVGVTMSQAKVLYLVQAEPDIRMSHLAGRLGVSLPSLSGVVERLVEQGLVSRRDDPGDRRQALLRITGSGITELERFRELNAHQVRAILARVDAADLDLVERAIQVLATAAAPAQLPTTATSPTTTPGGTPS